MTTAVGPAPRLAATVSLVARTLLCCAGLAALLAPAPPVRAAEPLPTFKGRESYSVRRVLSESAPLRIGVGLSESGEFLLQLGGDEAWVGQIVDTGRESRLEVTAEQFAAIESAIRSDFDERFASRFVSRAVRNELKAAEREAARLAAARDTLQARVDDLQTRIANLLGGGGIIPVDLLQSLQNEKALAETQLADAQAAVSSYAGVLAAARDRASPTFDVTNSTLSIAFRQNSLRTRVQVKARVQFDVRNRLDDVVRRGRRTITGGGRYQFTRG